jgi:hypothetical protein
MTRELLLSKIDTVGPGLFLQQLSAVDQKGHESTIPALDRHEPKFYWIFKNLDFIEWESGVFPALWLSGPTECRIDEVLSNIIRLGLLETSKSQHLLLYVFCSTLSGMRSGTTVLIHTMLHQAICSLPPDKQRKTVNIFLRTLIDKPFVPWLSDFSRGDSAEKVVRKILDDSRNELWDALKAILDAERERKLSIIIDGLEVEEQGSEFAAGILSLIAQLQKRPSMPKILLAGRPQAAIKEVQVSRLRLIEHDKERKGLAHFLKTQVYTVTNKCRMPKFSSL